MQRAFNHLKTFFACLLVLTALGVRAEESSEKGKWSVAFAVCNISDNTLGDYTSADFKDLKGPGSGETYNLTVARRIHEFAWNFGKYTMRPQLEVPFMLTLVDDQLQGVIPDFNIGVVIRWQNFPWNKFIYTTLSAGPGFSYATKIWTADYQRHPGEDRSNMKFWLPIEFTMALPQHKNVALVAFIDHQSGGHIFDQGGVDAWGFGVKVGF